MSENSKPKQAPHRFKPGQSGNPAGKPPGATNRATRLALTLLKGEEDALVRKVIELAKGGDMQALKVCLDRLCPPLKAQAAPIQVDLSGAGNMADICNVFIQAASAGRLSPDIAAQLVSAVGTLARVVEIDELKERLAALESAVRVPNK